jgi:hypothetical protein
MIPGVFTGFLILRMIALLVLLTVGAGALGIASLAHGSDAVGVPLLLAGGLLASATCRLVMRRASGKVAPPTPTTATAPRKRGQ